MSTPSSLANTRETTICIDAIAGNVAIVSSIVTFINIYQVLIHKQVQRSSGVIESLNDLYLDLKST